MSAIFLRPRSVHLTNWIYTMDENTSGPMLVATTGLLLNRIADDMAERTGRPVRGLRMDFEQTSNSDVKGHLLNYKTVIPIQGYVIRALHMELRVPVIGGLVPICTDRMHELLTAMGIPWTGEMSEEQIVQSFPGEMSVYFNVWNPPIEGPLPTFNPCSASVTKS